MKKKHTPTTRHRELSLMFLKMGKSLVDEGLKDKDYVTANLGNSMIFMASITLNWDDLKLFNEMCMMASTRNLLKKLDMDKETLKPFEGLTDLAKDDPFQEVLKRIKRDLEEGDENKENED